MTLLEFFSQSYTWADGNAPNVLIGSAVVPAAGTVLARIGKAGRTDADGRAIASTVMAVAILGVVLEIVGLFIAHTVFHHDVLEANALLLVAPVVCLVGAILGIRWVFPLSSLAPVRMLQDLAAFALACAAAAWFFSKFRGWSIFFHGSFVQLLVALAISLFFVRRLYRRAFGLDERPRA